MVQQVIHMRMWAVVSVSATGGLLCVLLASCATNESALVLAPSIPGAEFVGNATCEACHAKQVKNFPRSVHARIHSTACKDAKGTGDSGCESCHGPASKHVEAGGGVGVFIVNPGKSPEACFACHIEKKQQFKLPNHHPVLEGRMSCLDCHDAHGEDAKKPAGMAFAKVNDICAKCHKEQTGKFAYQHNALKEGCTSCHQVHGSINKKMLTYSDSYTCLQCHVAQGIKGAVNIGENHNTRLQQGACWSGGCHTAPHGSNISRTFRY